MTLTNQEIINYSLVLNNIFTGEEEFPVKAIFYIQKNQNTLNKLAEEINTCRMSIFKQYGDINEEGTAYVLREDTKKVAQDKLIELSEIEQKVDIKMLKLDDLKDIVLTKHQMEALMFMIEE